jgi:hypothetical protein
MSDVLDMIRAGVNKEESRREQNRREMPGTAQIVDEFTAAFGPVKVLHAIENGKEIGKPQPFDGIDVDKLIRLDDWHQYAQKGKRK